MTERVTVNGFNQHQAGKPEVVNAFQYRGELFILPCWSSESKEERCIQPYLQQGVTVVNLNYRLKRGTPVATEDLTLALNFLRAHGTAYPLDLHRVVLSGFSAGARLASLVAVTANDPTYPRPLAAGIGIAAVANFFGPVGGLDVVEAVLMNHPVPVMREIGLAPCPETPGTRRKK